MKNSNVKKVRKLLPKNIAGDILFFCVRCVIAALIFAEPIFLADLIDAATKGMLSNKYYLIFVILIIFLLRIVLTYIKNLWLYSYRCKCIGSLSSAMLNHVLHSKMKNFEIWTPTYLVSRMIDEPMNIDGILDYYFVDGIISFFICVGIVILMAVQSWMIAIISVFFVVFDYVIAMKLPLSKIYKSYNTSQAEWKSQTSNVFQGIKVIKLGNSYAFENKKFNENANVSLKSLFKKNMISHVQRTTGIICRQFGYLAVILLSAYLIASGKLGLGAFTMLISLNNLLWSNSSSAENIIPLYKYGKVTCDRIADILCTELEESQLVVPFEDSVNILEFKNVKFSYIESKSVLNGISFCAKAGQITTLTGYSGCGKSTILNLILGFINCSSGEIQINGKEINYAQLLSLRSKIGYVGQENFLFNRSILDNLLYYVSESEEKIDKINEYLKRLGLESFIKSLPDGFNSILGDNSSTVSGGEKQRLCIIRELLKDPEILILDECTAHLDAATEKLVFDFLHEYAKKVVIIQVAHRASAIANSDVIYVMDNGAIVSQGSNEELLNNSEFYQKLLAAMQDDSKSETC